MSRNELNDARHDLHHAKANLAYGLEVFGDTLREREKWKNKLTGLEAVRYYLMQKHHWLPSQVQSMSNDEGLFAMSEELAGWTLPADSI